MNNEKCMNCGTTVDVEGIDILPLKYGSRFDGWGTRVFLCKRCLSASPFASVVTVTNKELSESSDATDEDLLEYKNEDDMFNYIESLSLESQEKFFNSNAYGEFYTKLSPDVWLMAERSRLNG